MCQGHNAGDFTNITITKRITVDKCLAPEILWLNDQGVSTVNSCCGHGDSQGSILIHRWGGGMKRAQELGYNPKPYFYVNRLTGERTESDYAEIIPRFPQDCIANKP